ncbi:MAG: diversity-generating retroelement protein Avd [Thermodesulfobacteriota bacterium]
MAQELKVIQDFYDFTLWLISHTEKFPRHHRYSLGLAMENRLQRILELLLRAKYSRRKTDFLNDANIELEVLRFQVRLSKDLKALPQKSHGHAAERMQSIGAQIGGWLASKGVAS